MDLALNNLQRLICHKTQATKKPTSQHECQTVRIKSKLMPSASPLEESRRLSVTQTPVKDHQLMLMRKPHKELYDQCNMDASENKIKKFPLEMARTWLHRGNLQRGTNFVNTKIIKTMRSTNCWRKRDESINNRCKLAHTNKSRHN